MSERDDYEVWRQTQERLPRPATEEEMVEYARLYAEAVQEIEQIEQELRAARDEAKNRKVEPSETIARLGTVLVTGRREDWVPVEERADYRAGRVWTVRTDTGVVLSEREMTEGDRQVGIAPRQPVAPPAPVVPEE